MPSKYVVRNFADNSFYHIFNRGVEKRKIFLDDQDYRMFMYYLEIYTLSLDKILVKHPKLPIRLYNKNLEQNVDIISYCLMPNHFHLLIKQKKADGISTLLKQLTNAYTFYFNNKYKRVGSLMQGTFKAVNISDNDLLLHISRYIHLNPVVAGIADLEKYQWSSFGSYVKETEGVCKKEVILSQFPSISSYTKFHLDQVDYAENLEKIKHLLLEE